MAIAEAYLQSLGLKQGGSDAKELFLKVYTFLTRLAYYDAAKTRGRVLTKPNSNGRKSEQFDFMGTLESIIWPRGANAKSTDTTLLQKAGLTSVEISFDDPYAVPIRIEMSDMVMSPDPVDKVAKIAQRQGEALARTADLRNLSMILQSCFGSDLLTGDGIRSKAAAGSAAGMTYGAGGLLLDANIETSGNNVSEALFKLRTFFQANNAPEGGRTAHLHPVCFTNLVKDQGLNVTAGGTINNKVTQGLLGEMAGAQGNGSYTKVNIAEFAGFTIVEDNNLIALGSAINANSGCAAIKFEPDLAGAAHLTNFQGQGDSTGWDGGATRVADAYNQVRILAYQEECMGMLESRQGEGMGAKFPEFDDMALAYFGNAWNMTGHGTLRTAMSAYVTKAYAGATPA